MQRKDLSFQEIFNTLLAGQKLVLHFPNAVAAETFRTRLHKHKATQEKTFIALGLANEEERTVLQFRTKKAEDGEDVVAYVQFALPSPLRRYAVVVVEENDVNKEQQQDGNAQISTTVE